MNFNFAASLQAFPFLIFIRFLSLSSKKKEGFSFFGHQTKVRGNKKIPSLTCFKGPFFHGIKEVQLIEPNFD
jgi:hypothetical protein